MNGTDKRAASRAVFALAVLLAAGGTVARQEVPPEREAGGDDGEPVPELFGVGSGADETPANPLSGERGDQGEGAAGAPAAGTGADAAPDDADADADADGAGGAAAGTRENEDGTVADDAGDGSTGRTSPEGVFIPSEEIRVDTAITFPVDI